MIWDLYNLMVLLLLRSIMSSIVLEALDSALHNVDILDYDPHLTLGNLYQFLFDDIDLASFLRERTPQVICP